MNRPFYALAALVAALTGSAVGIGPARAPATTTRVAVAARAYCSLPEQNHDLNATYFVHFKASDSVDSEEAPTEELQGSDSTFVEQTVIPYEQSCGRDPLTGEVYCPRYEGETLATSETVEYWSLFNHLSEESQRDGANVVAESETWLSEEAALLENSFGNETVDDLYSESAAQIENLRNFHEYDCPYPHSRANPAVVSPQAEIVPTENEIDYENLYTPNDYVTENPPDTFDYEADRLRLAQFEATIALAQSSLTNLWLYAAQLGRESWERIASLQLVSAEMIAVGNQVDATSEDLSAQLYEDESIPAPMWVDEYFEPQTVVESITNDYGVEADYASAELAAARSDKQTEESSSKPVAGEYDSSLSNTAEPDYAAYNDEYQSNFEIDALDAEDANAATEVYLDDESSFDWQSDEEANGSFPSSSLRSLLRSLDELLEEIHQLVPQFRNDANDLLDLLDQVSAQWPEFVAYAQAQLAEQASRDEFEDYSRTTEFDHVVFGTEPTLPAEENISLEINWRDSIAQGLRSTGNLLLNWADTLEPTQNNGNAISSRAARTGSR